MNDSEDFLCSLSLRVAHCLIYACLIVASSETIITSTTTMRMLDQTTHVSQTTAVRSCIASLSDAIILLNLTNVPKQSYTFYEFTYSARHTQTRLTMSFRMDSNHWSLDSVSVTRARTTGDQLTNGYFADGDQNGWSACNPNNASNTGFVEANPSYAESGTYYWRDGSMGAADYLYQYFPSVVGSSYTIRFQLKGDGGLPNSAFVFIGP